MTHSEQLQWPSKQMSLSELVQRLLLMANEVQFVEIGLDGDQVDRLDAAKDALREIERALGEAMDSEDDAERQGIARRLTGYLTALGNDGLALTASVDQRTVEGAAGVGRLDVLSIVVDRQPALRRQAAAA